MRRAIILLSLLLGATIPALAQENMGIGAPNVRLTINFPGYPKFQQVPGYPVYYAPQVDANYFFYDGMYWVYLNDNWYASSWYNGPWALVTPMVVPVYILRVPVRYYREPPVYFHGWRQDAAPHWGDHWGDAWERQRSGWERVNRSEVPPGAPLPIYQQGYTGKTYPSYEQQRTIINQNYRYQPREPVVQQHYQRYVTPPPPVHAEPEHQQEPSKQDPGKDEGNDRAPEKQKPRAESP